MVKMVMQDGEGAGDFAPRTYPVSHRAVPGAKKMPPGMKAALERQLNRR